MSLQLKMLSYILVYGIALLSLAGCGQLNPSKPDSSKVPPQNEQTKFTLTPDGLKNTSDNTVWHMVWVDDFGAPTLLHKGLEPHLETFIRSVKVYTSVIDDNVVVTSANAGCNHIQWASRDIIATPSRTVETIVDGEPTLKSIPAVIKPRVQLIYGQEGCGNRDYEIDGKQYSVNWLALMEDFLIKNMRKHAILSAGNLEWIGQDGKPFARFERTF